MTTLKPLLAKNRSWALQRRQRNPHYFEKYLHQQKPHINDLQSGHLKELIQQSTEESIP